MGVSGEPQQSLRWYQGLKRLRNTDIDDTNVLATYNMDDSSMMLASNRHNGNFLTNLEVEEFPDYTMKKLFIIIDISLAVEVFIRLKIIAYTRDM